MNVALPTLMYLHQLAYCLLYYYLNTVINAFINTLFKINAKCLRLKNGKYYHSLKNIILVLGNHYPDILCTVYERIILKIST